MVIVIDGTGSMQLIIDDVKAKMGQLVHAIHRLVPIARVGMVVFGGKGKKMDIQPLTLNPQKLVDFLGSVHAEGGDEWEEDLAGGVNTAIHQMDWKPYAKKVIVLVGDSPPKKDDFQPLIAEIHQFKANNGTFNTVDVAAEEHERFEREFWLKVHREEPPKISPLPEFYQQTRAAFKVLANAGGGAMRSLSKDSHINQQVLVLAFGEQWQGQVAAFGRGISCRQHPVEIGGQRLRRIWMEKGTMMKRILATSAVALAAALFFLGLGTIGTARSHRRRTTRCAGCASPRTFRQDFRSRSTIRYRKMPAPYLDQEDQKKMSGKPYTDFVPKFEYLPNYGPNGQLSTVSVKLGGAEYDPTDKSTTKGKATGKLKYLVFSYTRQGSKWMPIAQPKWETPGPRQAGGDPDDRASEDRRSQQGDHREVPGTAAGEEESARRRIAEEVRQTSSQSASFDQI